MERLQRVVLNCDLPDVPVGGKTAAGTLITQSLVERMEFESINGIAFVRIVAKGTTAIWLFPFERVVCVELVGGR